MHTQQPWSDFFGPFNDSSGGDIRLYIDKEDPLDE